MWKSFSQLSRLKLIVSWKFVLPMYTLLVIFIRGLSHKPVARLKYTLRRRETLKYFWGWNFIVCHIYTYIGVLGIDYGKYLLLLLLFCLILYMKLFFNILYYYWIDENSFPILFYCVFITTIKHLSCYVYNKYNAIKY